MLHHLFVNNMKMQPVQCIMQRLGRLQLHGINNASYALAKHVRFVRLLLLLSILVFGFCFEFLFSLLFCLLFCFPSFTALTFQRRRTPCLFVSLSVCLGVCVCVCRVHLNAAQVRSESKCKQEKRRHFSSNYTADMRKFACMCNGTPSSSSSLLPYMAIESAASSQPVPPQQSSHEPGWVQLVNCCTLCRLFVEWLSWQAGWLDGWMVGCLLA
ncbi:unnamed protein product [Ceratitis capitata]|uniref:(Mediterranean fruit fly) hypothetical protein n=1 Tax=Ceratitis capitata TaxID=7213 RepID=A0A811U604_CERCA|nr:unnamed protein product [Ceratitis capitata]